MSLYDSFIDTMSAHPSYVQKMEIRRNEKIAAVIDRYVNTKEAKKALEVGIGIGLFKDAITKLGYAYTGIDRNQKMLDLVNHKNDGSKAICANVPPVPEELKLKQFDVTYAAFVAEHMADGIELFSFVEELKHTLKENGTLVLIMPDARSMGMEFWNQDYTHRYPTTERNVSCIVREAGCQIEKIVHYRGAMWTGFMFWLWQFIGFFYSYQWMGRLFGHKAFFYSVYQYIKIDTLFFICTPVK
jgi:predicted TPR repeat methyltransferase